MSDPGHPAFPQPADPSKPVWRYLDMPKLVSLLTRRELFLARLDNLTDIYEGTMPRQSRDIAIQQLTAGLPAGAPLEMAIQAVDGRLDLGRLFRKRLYVSCWRLDSHESEAMWRIYCPDSQGVAIRLPYGRLQMSLPAAGEVFIGMVRYIDFANESIAPGNLFLPAMHKRREFEYENEIRIVRWILPNTPGSDMSRDDPKQPLSAAIPWKVEMYIDNIVVSPYSMPWYFDAVSNLVEKLAPALSGKIIRSAMGFDPF